jgi:hypothetical protein
MQLPYLGGVESCCDGPAQLLAVLPGVGQAGAKTASKPAIARLAGVVRSSASVNETKPTPRCSSSWSVASRSATDRPQRSSRQTNTTSISRRRAASSRLSRSCRCEAPLPTSFTCRAIVQPRRAAYSRKARICNGMVCWSLVETRA